ncbi:unnamed protein product [Peronospora farinosa]|uniref:RxLR effector candidate protein n=1 Tax=Peronospora farinosa TaxID=134698 RepID=A0ABN8CGW2_9STRA|nr:unnamed protein product [Peronospora farinosa]
MIVNPNPNLPKRLQWYIVLAALTCVSASPNTVEPKTIFASSAASKPPLGVVDQSDARVKRYLRRNTDTTESMDDESEDRGSDVFSTIDQGLAARITESVEAGVTPKVSTAIEQGLAAKVGESVVTPSVSGTNHNPAAKVEESIETSVTHEVPTAVNHDQAAKVGESVEASAIPSVPGNIYNVFYLEFRKAMGDQIEFYRNRGDLFKNDQYTKWSKTVDEVYKKISETRAEVAYTDVAMWAEVAKVSTLLSIYEKDVVISMLAAGRKDPVTQEKANNLGLGLLRKWVSDRKDDNIMDLLTFDKGKSEVLMSPFLKVWFNYLRKMNINPYEPFVTHFTKRYSEKELVELLVVAERDDRTRQIATKLAKKIWKNTSISLIRSFKLFGLNNEHLDTLLRNPTLSTWINYVEMLGPNPYEVLLLAMRERAGDEKLDSILAAAKVDGTYMTIWQTLLHMQENYKSLKRLKREYPQVEEWQRDGKSGDDVFDLLEFPDKGQDMFATEAWSLWVAYMTYLEAQKQLEDQREIATVIFSVLRNRFSSEDLPKLVATAKNVDRTKELAAIWEQRLWRIAKQTPDDVFDLLKLKEKGDAVFESPEFENWALYVKELNNGRSRDDDFELACQLYRHYGPDVERLLEQSEKMAIEKKDKVTKAFVNKMQNEFEMIKSLEEMSPAEMELEETSSVEMELEETSPVDMDIEESSPVEMKVEETSHEKKQLGKRPRTSSPAVATESSKRTKMLDESESPTEN